MNIGDTVPDLLGTDAEGREVRLSDYPDKKVILYFYPKDNT
ncbi:MAG: peroxiredoxin family protein, partial [Muribaculaceae bacterium]|nr:peroxiredoxin family protein [Muribaculaceae bacterium]